MKLARIGKRLRADALSVCSSIYRMNAPGAIGYVFNATGNKSEVCSGMFVNYLCELDANHWTYYFEFKTEKFFRIGD